MKVLFVTPFRLNADNVSGGVFAERQIASLRSAGVEGDIFVVEGNTSPRSVVRNIRCLRRRIRTEGAQVVHAQYGSVTAMVACLAAVGLARVVVSFCGSDLNGSPAISWLQSQCGVFISQIAAVRAAAVICKSKQLADRLWFAGERALVIPNGVDLELFRPLDRRACRERLGLDQEAIYLLFNDGNRDPVKRADLARAVVDQLGCAMAPRPVRLLVLRGVQPAEVVHYLNAVDALIITSDKEGSPNILKEGLACRTPLVTFEVGDVRERLEGVPFGRIVPRDVSAMVAALVDLVTGPVATEPASNVLRGIDQKAIAETIIQCYESVLGANPVRGEDHRG